MATIATVATIAGTGTVFAVNAVGVQRIVKAGDVLEKGETLRTVGDATVELLMDDGNLMAVAPDKTVHLDDNVSQSDALPTAADSALSSTATSETIIQALERGTDLSTTLDATSAGLDGGGGGGNSFVQLLRISEGVDAQSYNFNFSGLGVLPIAEGVGVVAAASNIVAGANDAPVAVSATNSATEGGSVVTGHLIATDANNLTLSYGAVGTVPAGLTLNTDGSYSFDPTNAAYDHLAAGERQEVVLNFKASDGVADSATQTLTITITGTNDVPTFSTGIGHDAGGVTEDATTPTLSTTGTLVVSDTDHGQSGIDTTVAPVPGAGALGSIVIDAQGNWTYSVDNSKVQYLSAGEPKVETFTVKSTDGTSHDITITITGTNDVPTFSTGVGQDAGGVVEDSAITTLTTTGTLVVTDVDHGQSGIDTSVAPVASAGALGSIVIDAQGKWTYTVDNSKVQYLAADEPKVETFTVKSTDGTSHDITITITGTNDAAVITGETVAALTETNAVLGTGGQLHAAEVDSAATFVAQSGVVGSNGYGSFSIDANGSWKYDTNSAHDEFKDGIKYTDSVTVKTADGTEQVLTVTITGTNDAAVITGDTTAALTETNAVLSAAGQLHVADVDSAATFVAQSGVVGSNGYGSFSIDANGSWKYDTNSAHDEFKDGMKYTDSVTVKTADGTEQVLTVTITGTNDVPAITTSSGNAENAHDVVNEAMLAEGTQQGGGSTSASGTFTVADADGLHDIQSIKIGGSEVSIASLTGYDFWLGHGTLHIDSYNAQTGVANYTYTLTSALNSGAVAGANTVAGGESFDVTVRDSAGGSASATIAIDIKDDVPVAKVTSPGYLQYGESEHDKDMQDVRDTQRKDKEDDDSRVSDAKSKVHDQESNRDAHDEDGSKRIAEAEKSLKDAKEHYGSNGDKAHEAQAELDRAKIEQAKQHDLDEKSVKSAGDELAAALNTQQQHEVADEKRVQDSESASQLNSFSGTLASIGADATGAQVTWDKPADINLGDAKTLSYVLSHEGALLQAFVQDQQGSSKLAFALDAHIDGTYQFTQYQTLDAKVNLSFGFTATDGDKDSVHGSLQLVTQKTLIGNHSEDGHEVGSSDNDFIKVGTGNHLLEGKEGADVFKWGLSDHDGTKLSIDHIKDFDVTSKGDTLDLRDLLHGSLDSDHLQFGKVGDKLALLVSQDGHLDSSGDGADVKIVLDNRDGSNVESAKVTLAHELDPGFSGHSISDHDLLKKLVDTGHLKADS